MACYMYWKPTKTFRWEATIRRGYNTYDGKVNLLKKDGLVARCNCVLNAASPYSRI
jgi:hypothetical protein